MNPAPSRLERSAFYVLLASVVLAPLAFWPSAYAPFDLAKAAVIAFGVLASAILLAILAFGEKRAVWVSRPLFWATILLCLSVVASSILSGHLGKSFFGQGFEAGTASFILVLFLGAGVVFKLVRREQGRAVVLYAGIVASFLVLYVFQLMRMAFGPGFASLGVLSGVASTVFGGWYALSAFALAIALIAASALLFLPLSRRLRVFYWIILALSLVGAFVVNDARVWAVGALAFLGLAVFESARRAPAGSGVKGFFSNLAWIPLVACIVAALLFWKGGDMANSVAGKLGASYSDAPALSWRGTLDVAAGAMKASPIFGVGPNRFAQAYLDNKPSDVNVTNAWGLEFATGWSTLSTFVVTEGLSGAVLWILFLVFLGVAGVRALRRLPEDPQARFLVVSSLAAAAFLWAMASVSVLPHALLFLAFVFTGIFLASAANAGSLAAVEVAPVPGTGRARLASVAAIAAVVVLAVWGAVYAKKTVALGHFASGVKALTGASSPVDPAKADAEFAAAEKWDASDVYLQGRAEAAIAEASGLVSTLNAQSPASTSQAVLTQAANILNGALGYTVGAIKLDPANYYNYVSEARVATAAARLQIPNAYETGVKAYASAIQLNPSNPSLYLSLAQLQASSNKLDDALSTVGAAIRVKGNYLDAVFLLSQIEAAKGNLPDAITAAQFAAQLNPQSPIVFFQLGLLEYENRSYAASADAFAAAIKAQPDYANAQYFLGLAQARLGKSAEAIAQFQSLAESNPDNQEVAFILADLKAGKSPFADAQQAVATAPEKLKALPIKQK